MLVFWARAGGRRAAFNHARSYLGFVLGTLERYPTLVATAGHLFTEATCGDVLWTATCDKTGECTCTQGDHSIWSCKEAGPFLGDLTLGCCAFAIK